MSSDPRVVEVHPEVSFRALKGDVLLHPKRSWNGLQERIRLLADAGIRLPSELPCDRVAADDVVDAAVAAWSARRVARGEAGVLPRGAGLSRTGRGGRNGHGGRNGRDGNGRTAGDGSEHTEARAWELGRIWY